MKHSIKHSKEDTKQVAWESWFVMSLTTVIGIAVVMALGNSREVQDLPYLMAIAMINLLACVCVGLVPRIQE